MAKWVYRIIHNHQPPVDILSSQTPEDMEKSIRQVGGNGWLKILDEDSGQPAWINMTAVARIEPREAKDEDQNQ